MQKQRENTDAETRGKHLTPTGETDTIILTDNLSVDARSIYIKDSNSKRLSDRKDKEVESRQRSYGKAKRDTGCGRRAFCHKRI